MITSALPHSDGHDFVHLVMRQLELQQDVRFAVLWVIKTDMNTQVNLST